MEATESSSISTYCFMISNFLRQVARSTRFLRPEVNGVICKLYGSEVTAETLKTKMWHTQNCTMRKNKRAYTTWCMDVVEAEEVCKDRRVWRKRGTPTVSATMIGSTRNDITGILLQFIPRIVEGVPKTRCKRRVQQSVYCGILVCPEESADVSREFGGRSKRSEKTKFEE
uniref:Uncharacterized protein n=1 Tax=Timema poppense TaxID=170557 RepID=A0A7R9D3P9_TIMPO|nr:unnamed protein product [Timema poppensis]